MAIDTSSRVWQEAESSKPTASQRLSEHFQSNPERAYHARELADEIMGTHWDMAHREERGEAAEGAANEDAVEDERTMGDSIRDAIETTRLESELEQLEEQGEIEARNVPTEESDIPYDWENVTYYSLV